MKTILFFLLPITLFAQSFILSNIPLPKTYIQNLDPYECNEVCMQNYLDHGKIFSFLAHADKQLSEEQNEIRLMSIAIFNLGSLHNTQKINIALLLPYKKIGKYASSITNAVFSYLITKNHPFMLKSYKVDSENIEDLQNSLQEIQKDSIKFVIAPLTQKGVQNIISINPSLHIYFPTINKKDVNSSSKFLSFGAIDYIEQSNLLLKEAQTPLVIFSDKSQTGKKLAHYQKEQFLKEHLQEEDTFNKMLMYEDNYENQEVQINSDITVKKPEVINYFISRQRSNLEPYLKENEKIKQASFMLNTPIIKSGMIMSQLTLYDTNATNILSTQINYDPLLLSMTQYIDRKNMIVANSITKNNNVLIETNALLGNDIVYDWINYTTTIGIDYFYSLATGEESIYDIPMQNQQMLYQIELLQPARSKFIKYIQKVSLKETQE